MAKRKAHINNEELKRLYDDNKTFEQLAADFGISMGTIGRRLRMAGTVIRPAVRRSAVVDHQLAASLYQDEKLSVENVAVKMGISAADITNSLDSSGIARRSKTAHRKRKYPDLNNLAIGESFEIRRPAGRQPHTRLYDKAAKIGIRIAFKTIDANTVRITRMPPAPPKPTLDAEEIKRLYQDESHSIVKIAARLAIGEARVKWLLKKTGVEMRPASPRRFEADEELILGLLKRGELSVKEIAVKTGVPARHIQKIRRSDPETSLQNKPPEIYAEITALTIGDSVDFLRPVGNRLHQRFYKLAERNGMRVSFRFLDDSTVRVTRVK